MKRIIKIPLFISIFALLTACGGKSEPVLTKSDPVAGIYLGGKLPGISEEMMKDPNLSAKDVLKNLEDKGYPPKEYEKELLLLGKAANLADRWDAGLLDQAISAGEIAGYIIDRGVHLYSENGYSAFVFPNPK